MILILLIVIPFLSGLISFALKGNGAKTMALLGSLATLAFAVAVSCHMYTGDTISFTKPWIPNLGTQFSLFSDGMSAMLCLLTAIVTSVVVISQWNKPVDRPSAFWGLMMLSQAGLMGVFLAYDALVFYIFWELALIPVYFLCSIWGGERRIPVTFKFFVYTFVGSLLMLAALIYLSIQTPGVNSFAWGNMVQAGRSLSPLNAHWVFWLLFIAFAIKMPVFPFHTWQPDTYEQSPTPVTIILSALMVKMGMFAVLRWLLPVVPDGVSYWANTVVIMSVTGIIYASFLAIVQTDLKRLIAYSSIAHMGLMCAAAFSNTQVGMHGIMVQMFNHGINITGMWLIASMIEERFGTRDMNRLGGMASTTPKLAIALVVIALANIALPLTNGFIGEFMLFNGLFQNPSNYHITFMVLAGLGVILGAVYTLNMVQRTAYGSAGEAAIVKDLSINEFIAITVVILFIVVLGIYPQPLLDLTSGVANMLVK